MSPSKDFELALREGRPTPSKFAPRPESRLIFFQDYLANMEVLIEAEIQKRYKDFEIITEKLKDDDERDLEWQMTCYELEQLKQFASVLRASFFVSLYAYVETYMIEQYRKSGEQQKVEKPLIVNTTKIMAKGLVHVNKIPQWTEINSHIDIRNCLAHGEGRLDNQDRSEKIKKYAKRKPTLLNIVTVSEYSYDEPSTYEQIILEKGFCEHALETVDKFLYSIEVISEEKKRLTR